MISGPVASDSVRSFLRRPILGVGQLLVPDLGLHPIADDRGVGVRGLGLLGGGAGGGASRSRASLAHGGDAQRSFAEMEVRMRRRGS
jgi:hypothetical protein